jgi:iron complex transport system ATP-binding protein
VSRLAARGVAVSFDGISVVDGVDLEVGAGEWVAVIGPNGAGKTSLLRALAGIVDHEGSITIDDTPVVSLHRRAVARRLAMVPQRPSLPDAMVVLDYVLLGRTPHLGYLAAETDHDLEVARGSLDRLGASGLSERRLGSLSGGERQRVVLARALAQAADVLLLDEPTTSLDVGHAQQVLELVDELRRERGIAVVAAIHDLTLAAEYAERLILLDRGRVVATGRPDQVLTEDGLSRFSGARVSIMRGPGGEVVVVPRRPSAAGLQ